jgi:toxin ParE1/3/4
MKIKWSPLSLERISEIADYISQDKPGAALNWIDSIFESMNKVDAFPKSGRMVPEVGLEDIREVFVGNYRVIYRIEDDRLSVLTVRHGKQLLSKDDL